MGAYDPINLRPSWGGTSVTMFGLMVLFVSSAGLLSRQVMGVHLWSVVILVSLPLFSLVGATLGVVGLRRSRSRLEPRLTALVGTTLHCVVLACCLFALAYTVAT